MADTNGVSAGSLEIAAGDTQDEVKTGTDSAETNDKKAVKSVTNAAKQGSIKADGPPSRLERQVIRQIEYYFGDINLPKDKYLLEQIKLEDGWVPLEVMFKFKRLAGLTTDPDAVIVALLKSTEKLMEVSDDRKKIRRCPSKPLPIMNEERKKELSARTLYVKGFPQTGVTLDNVLEFFASHGPVENVYMRSFKDKATNQTVFKGSVFVTFKEIEGAKKFLELESVKHEDTELIKKWQVEYFEDKRKERDEKRSKNKSENVTPAPEAAAERELPKGCILHFKGLSEGNEITREQIKAQLAKLGAEVAFVNYSKGDTELWVRLHKENSAKNVLTEHMPEGTYKLCDCDVEVKVLEGEEEETFLEKTKQGILANAQRHGSRGRGNQRGRSRGGRGGGRGHGGRGQKRRGSPNRDHNSPSKKQAV